jgi:hypothetical protein
MVLFLNPENEKALKAVKRLESLTADEYEDELFSMQPLTRAVKNIETQEAPVLEPLSAKTPAVDEKILERYLSLADAYTVRNDLDRALETLDRARREFGEHREIQKRTKILQQRLRNEEDEDDSPPAKTPAPPPPSRRASAVQEKINLLERVLYRIKSQGPS